MTVVCMIGSMSFYLTFNTNFIQTQFETFKINQLIFFKYNNWFSQDGPSKDSGGLHISAEPTPKEFGRKVKC